MPDIVPFYAALSEHKLASPKAPQTGRDRRRRSAK
jgi:hypothetical protein